MDLDE